MKIYNSTEYIEHPKIGDMRLKVINMFDFLTNAVCYQTIDSTFGGGKTTIAYSVEICSEIISPKHIKWQNLGKITEEIKKTLTKKGVPACKTVAEAMSWGMSSDDNVISPENWKLLIPLVHES